ncbi:MAG: hypothetical protein WCC26_18995 [Terracidiphilus sp.]
MHGVHAILPANSSEAGAAPSQRLVKAAHEFEAQLMTELLKPLSTGASSLGGEDEEGSGGTLGEFAAEALGSGLSDLGGLGIADRILKTLSQSGTGPNPAGINGKA